jgi:antitoxin (DNA-binding transcriptional repressor) of toxin-antitoxin stability system
MKMGVKEFRERFSELAEGAEPVFVTKNGRVVGKYDPLVAPKVEGGDWAAVESRLAEFRAEWTATTPDWRARLASIGLDETGEEISA